MILEIEKFNVAKSYPWIGEEFKISSQTKLLWVLGFAGRFNTWVVPRYFFLPKSYFFCELKPHAKFRNPTITPSGRKVTQGEREKKERKKNAVNSEHLVP